MTDKEIISLREDIVLGSLFLSDYTNTFNLKVADVFDFFDTFLNYLGELMEEDIEDYSDEKFWEYLPQYDNTENLLDFFHSYPYELEQEEEENI